MNGVGAAFAAMFCQFNFVGCVGFISFGNIIKIATNSAF